MRKFELKILTMSDKIIFRKAVKIIVKSNKLKLTNNDDNLHDIFLFKVFQLLTTTLIR